ncbi:MAG: secretin N-terminal domain-containing protein [Pseudomonadota bacterium]
MSLFLRPWRGLLFLALVFAPWPSGAQSTQINLRDADLSSYIELVAELTGRNFIVDPRVTGTVTIIAPGTIGAEEAYRIFLNVLELNRFTVVEGDGADRIVPAQVARELAPGAGPLDVAGYVTEALRVDNIPLGELVEIVQPLLPPEAVLTTYPTARLLILSDREANIARIRRLIARLDRPVQSEILVVPLRNAEASQLVDILSALELTSPGASVTADARSNSLVVTGPDAFKAQVRSLVGELDRPRNVQDATVVQLSYADATEIEQIGLKLFAAQAGGGEAPTGAAIVADPNTNSVLISAPPDLLASVVNAVRRLDTRPNQVLIEGVIFEMSADNFAELGVQFGAIIGNVFAGGVQFNLANAPQLGSLVTTLLSGGIPAFGSGIALGAGSQGDQNSAAGFLSALARDTSTNILSTPSILTLNNEEAEIVVAANVPFVTGRFSTVGESTNPEQPFQTIQREDVGLTLTVTPQITGDGTVRLKVSQEVSNLTAAAAASGGEITQRRAISSSIIVGDGALVLLGGLIEETASDTREKVPGAGDLPVLGNLFRAKSAQGTKRILLLLLRPTIVSTDADARTVTDQSYNAARVQQGEILAGADERYPSANRVTLPPLIPSLAEPFRPSTSRAKLPPLPPRLDLGR